MNQTSQHTAPAPWPPTPSTYTYPGARWWKMDFHTHTPESEDYANGEKDSAIRTSLKKQTPEDWLKCHMAAGLDAVVVTDHNTTAFIPRLKAAYAAMDQSDPSFRPLIIFPGFELSTNGGLHLLAVFDPGKALDDVSGAISSCGYVGVRGQTNSGVCSKSFADCVKVVKNSGGLAIAAHVDEPCGLLWMDAPLNGRKYRNLRNQHGLTHAAAIQQLITDGEVAANIVNYSISIGQTLFQVLESGLDALEVRDWASLPESDIQRHSVLARMTRVTGSDSHMPRHIGRYGFSMVHMTRPDLEGLRLAFADGSAMRAKNAQAQPSQPVLESWSVRPVSKSDCVDWNTWPDQSVDKVSISQIKTAGRVVPLEIPLHPRLNVFVGGRGTGKSTFVHALRLASHRGRELPRYESDAPVQESPAGDFWRWAQIPAARGQDGVILRDASVVKIHYRSPAQAAELLWQASALGPGPRSSPPTVRVGELGTVPTADGGAYTTSRFPLSIYSQKHVLEMSRGSAGLMEIIDREQNVAALEEKQKQTVAAYSATKAKIRELTATVENEAQDEATLKDIQTELEKIQSDAVKEYQRRQAQARILLPNLNPDSPLLILAQGIEKQAARVGLPDIPAASITATDAALVEAHALYQAAQKELDVVADQIRVQCSAIQKTLSALDHNLRGSSWFQLCTDAKTAYDAVLGTQAVAIDPERLTKLNQDRVQLEERLGKHKVTKEEVARLESTAAEQLEAVKTARLGISAARAAFVTNHNAKGTLLRLTIITMGADNTRVERSLREAMGVDAEKFGASIGLAEGSRADSIMRIFQEAPDHQTGASAVRHRILSLIESKENEQGFADLQNNLRRQITNNPSRRDAIETWFPEDHLKLEYRTTESTEWKSISQGSIGQQTAAILSFLLSFGKEPLVLDQPEDDLDTRMIMSLVVEQVRRMKEHRQIMIVTHNPNIVVHGDADLVHAMVDEGGQVSRSTDASGGLQDKATRKFICDVMEGGAIAFRKRFDRMGREEL